MEQRAFLDDFADAVRSVLAGGGATTEAIWSLGPHLQRLRTHPGLPPLLEAAAEEGAPLYRDPDEAFVLGYARFGPDHVTPVHSHGGWGLLCLLSGEDHYTSWRSDDGSLTLVQDHHLRPNDLAYWFPAPYNVHRQAAGPDGTTELVLHQGDGRRVHEFDLDTGEARPAPRPERRA